MWPGAVALVAFFLLTTQIGMAAEDLRPSFQKLRYEEDYSYLRDPANRMGSLDALKFIPFDGSGDSYLTVGGEVRQRYAYTVKPLFGAGPQDKVDVWLQRYVLQGDLHVGEHLRFFGQFYSALETGGEGGPSPVDENQLQFQNAFFELSFSPMKATTLSFRGGRQEVQFGSGRLVDVREGPNVRRTLNALRFIFKLPDWRIDAIVARPRQLRPGVFDDGSKDDQTLWGLYAIGGQDTLQIGQLDLYYLGFRDDEGSFEQGIAKETRHSLGARLWGEAGNWDFNWETIYQFGEFGTGNISAWTVASETGYTWSDNFPWRPRLALSANIASGDDDPNDDDLGTFNALFPRGNYFSQAAVLGPRNFFNVHSFVTLNPSPDWLFTTSMNFFWRLQTEDGVYSPSGQLIRASKGNDERFVGSAISFTSDWVISRNLAFTAVYAHFFPGAFIKETGSADNIDYFEITLRFRF